MQLLRSSIRLQSNLHKCSSVNRISLSTNSVLRAREEAKDTGPVVFTKSPAYRGDSVIKMSQTFDIPGYQFPVITISMFSLMVEGLERAQLEVCIKYYEESGMDTRALKARLQELDIIDDEKELAAKEQAQ